MLEKIHGVQSQVELDPSQPVLTPTAARQESQTASYVAPFAVFAALLAAQPYTAALGRWEPLVRVLLLSAVLLLFSRPVLDLRVRQFWSSLGVGVLVFVVWIGPDQLFPHYREHWLYQNFLTGTIGSSLHVQLRGDAVGLFLRALRAIVLVPIIEELFWRAWLMRYIISPHIAGIPLGTYTRLSFWVVALLFASEHGVYWDVGLAAGLLYNAWMVRTRSLGDCVLAHAVTNALLSGYVLLTKQWQYWQ